MPTPESRFMRWRTTAYLVWSAIGILVLLAAAGWAMGRISSALIPFVIAFILVFLFNGPVAALERRGMSRSMATLLSFAIGIVSIGAALTFLLPPLARQVVEFAHQMPEYLAQVEQFVREQQASLSRVVFPGWFSSALKTATEQLGQFAVTLGNVLARTVLSVGGGVLTGFFDVFIAVVISFWVLKDLPKMREELVVLVGPSHEEDAETLLKTVIHVVGGYLKGQTIASLVTGFLATVGLAIIGVPYALVLGLITFIFNYIPIVGPFIGAAIAALVGLFVSPLTALLAIVIVVLAQQLTDNLVTPRVMSDQVDLHPTLVIFSLLVGGTLFGVPGMLFAIPVAATIKGLFVYYYERHTKRQLETEGGAFFRGSSESEDEDPCEDPHEDPHEDTPSGADSGTAVDHAPRRSDT